MSDTMEDTITMTSDGLGAWFMGPVLDSAEAEADWLTDICESTDPNTRFVAMFGWPTFVWEYAERVDGELIPCECPAPAGI